MFNMTPYEVYVFILCAVVFTIFTVLFSVMLGYLVSLNLKLIKHGVNDAKIKTEYQKRAEKPPSKIGKFVDRFVSILLCVVMFVVFSLSVYLQVTEDKVPDGIPSVKVVKSASMSKKHEKNTYLEGIDNQIQTFDIILAHDMPDEYELKLYDVVYYEIDGEMVLHRIVKIEEPNEKHPDCRWFELQGDAVQYPDMDPVLYSQMRGIYRDQKMPFIGSFVMFMQSPAGYLCILLIVIAMIATPIMEKKLERAKANRMLEILAMGKLVKWNRDELRQKIFDIGGKSLIFHSVGFIYWFALKKHRDD